MGIFDSMVEAAEDQSMLDHDKEGNPYDPTHALVNADAELDVGHLSNVGATNPTLPKPRESGFAGIGHGFLEDAADSAGVDVPDVPEMPPLGLYAKAVAALVVIYVLGQLFDIQV